MSESNVPASRLEPDAEEWRKRMSRVYVMLVNLARQKRAAAQAESAYLAEPGH
jgi:hypothetical protein